MSCEAWRGSYWGGSSYYAYYRCDLAVGDGIDLAACIDAYGVDASDGFSRAMLESWKKSVYASRSQLQEMHS